MNESLDQFVDNYFECLLSVIDSIQAGDKVNPIRVQEVLVRKILSARNNHQHDEHWESALYALVALTDELMLDMPWEGRNWWSDHVLEVSVFGTRICSERFYQLANEAARNHVASTTSSGGLLRVFYECVLLGFRGVYSTSNLSPSTTKAMGIPPTMEAWLDKTQRELACDNDPNQPARQHRRLTGAVPNASRRSVVWWSMAAGMMLIANLTIYSFTR